MKNLLIFYFFVFSFLITYKFFGHHADFHEVVLIGLVTHYFLFTRKTFFGET